MAEGVDVEIEVDKRGARRSCEEGTAPPYTSFLLPSTVPALRLLEQSQQGDSDRGSVVLHKIPGMQALPHALPVMRGRIVCEVRDGVFINLTLQLLTVTGHQKSRL